jgi:hypothetical protein
MEANELAVGLQSPWARHRDGIRSWPCASTSAWLWASRTARNSDRLKIFGLTDPSLAMPNHGPRDTEFRCPAGCRRDRRGKPRNGRLGCRSCCWPWTCQARRRRRGCMRRPDAPRRIDGERPFGQLDVLVNNAGIWGESRTPAIWGAFAERHQHPVLEPRAARNSWRHHQSPIGTAGRLCAYGSQHAVVARNGRGSASTGHGELLQLLDAGLSKPCGRSVPDSGSRTDGLGERKMSRAPRCSSPAVTRASSRAGLLVTAAPGSILAGCCESARSERDRRFRIASIHQRCRAHPPGPSGVGRKGQLQRARNASAASLRPPAAVVDLVDEPTTRRYGRSRAGHSTAWNSRMVQPRSSASRCLVEEALLSACAVLRYWRRLDFPDAAG